ncbi:beta-ketoacyl-ACP synthase III [Brevibacillus choshinensis]|uniref:beta-ketoacyl-ACP synthase III n=1 Tax=Brevibacillus choshinensis TaxID=54911 RepID=UPI002E1C4293|nr:beta-ketoacyl-ACP synthase III [Brevibacillus choshinensis]MED4779862.1 beta-ketoacyl-ACP synthase III [Brevibacillus choshinensis]
MERKVKILGTGKYLPDRQVTAEELERKLGLPAGWVVKKSGVQVRHFVTNETSAQMGAIAAQRALDEAGLVFSDIECLVCASGTSQQEIPCTAALIQEEMNQSKSGVPCFDINSTCLSFVTALDVLSWSLAMGCYQRILIVSTEISSVGLNWGHKESCVLFGDGAAAVVISRTPQDETSRILASRMQTFSDGAHYSEIRGGGTLIHPSEYANGREADFQFDMDGRKIFRLTSQLITGFVDQLLDTASVKKQDIGLVVPHQASGMAMRIMGNKLGFANSQMMNIIVNHGNVIAASIPMALHEAIVQEKVRRGDFLLLLGTSAGLSLGGLLLEY